MLSQVQAIGARNGNPLLAVSGARFEDGGAVFGIGKIVSGIPSGGTVAYVESTLTGVTALLEAAQQAREQARETLPEFLFTDSGANSSGSALSWRASAFASKIEEIRGRWFDSLARLTAIAVAMDAGRAYEPARDRLRITGSPVLPVHLADEVRVLHEILDKRGLTRRDYLAHLQRLGVVSNDHTPDEYATLVGAEEQAATDREVEAARRVLADGARVPPDDIDGDTGEDVE
jgi:hypothetical protein